jgi:GTPase SAR1 family protein
MASSSSSDDSEILDQQYLLLWKARKLEFRILILGRANAGKTTILERLTGASIDEAKVTRNGKILPGQVRRVRMFAILRCDPVYL